MRPGVRRAVASAFPMWVACISGRNSEKGGLPLSSVSCQVPVLILETSRTLFENLRFDFRTRKLGKDLGDTRCYATAVSARIAVVLGKSWRGPPAN